MIHSLLELWVATRYSKSFFLTRDLGTWSPSRNVVNTSMTMCCAASSQEFRAPLEQVHLSRRHYQRASRHSLREGTRSGLSSAGWRAEYRRQPLDGRATLCAMILHIKNEFFQKTMHRFQLMRMIRAVMVQHHVVFVAGDFNGCWRPSSGAGWLLFVFSRLFFCGRRLELRNKNKNPVLRAPISRLPFRGLHANDAGCGERAI